MKLLYVKEGKCTIPLYFLGFFFSNTYSCYTVVKTKTLYKTESNKLLIIKKRRNATHLKLYFIINIVSSRKTNVKK